LTDRLRENPWIAATFVLGVVVLIFVISVFTNVTDGTVTGGAVGVNEAGDILGDFINAQTDGEGEVISVESFNDNLYEATILYQGQEVGLFLTKDGMDFF